MSPAFYSYLIGAVSRPRRQRHSDVKNKQGTMCVCAYCRLPSGLSTRAFFSPTERGHQVYKEDLESRSSSWWCLRRRARPDDLKFKSEAFALRLIIKLNNSPASFHAGAPLALCSARGARHVMGILCIQHEFNCPVIRRARDDLICSRRTHATTEHTKETRGNKTMF